MLFSALFCLFHLFFLIVCVCFTFKHYRVSCFQNSPSVLTSNKCPSSLGFSNPLLFHHHLFLIIIIVSLTHLWSSLPSSIFQRHGFVIHRQVQLQKIIVFLLASVIIIACYFIIVSLYHLFSSLPSNIIQRHGFVIHGQVQVQKSDGLSLLGKRSSACVI